MQIVNRVPTMIAFACILCLLFDLPRASDTEARPPEPNTEKWNKSGTKVVVFLEKHFRILNRWMTRTDNHTSQW